MTVKIRQLPKESCLAKIDGAQYLIIAGQGREPDVWVHRLDNRSGPFDSVVGASIYLRTKGQQ